MKVAIVHDDLVQWGGAERVLEAICELFPDAPIYTSLFDKSNRTLNSKFGSKKVITSFLQKIPGWKSLYKVFLPLYPIAFEQFDFSQYDLVISQTTRFSKSIITKPETLHICYCHTPPRFLWNFSNQKTSKLLLPMLSFLRILDRISSSRVDLYLAGSKNCQQRITKIYKRDSKLLYPFVDLEKLNQQTFDGGYFLIVSRLIKYKKIDVVVDAFNKLNVNLKIVGTGPELPNLLRKANNNIEFIGGVNENLLFNLLAGCRCLVLMAEEDFGLTSLEAQAFGKPVIAYKSGGALETVIEGKTGLFFDTQTSASLIKAINNLEKIKINPKNCIDNAKNFSKESFLTNLKSLIENKPKGLIKTSV